MADLVLIKPGQAISGEYRIICEIGDSAKTVTVLQVEHRRDAYR